MKKSRNGRQKFEYWFDTQMSKGTSALIKLLVIMTLCAILIIAVVGLVAGYNEETSGIDIIWDSFATVINAWMPYYSDGGGSIGYLLIMMFAAIVGLLVTSILIGIISTAIEERVDSLKEGRSKVLEDGHIVVLGFVPGEYTLISQLIMAAGDEKRCILICADMDLEEMKDLVLDNVEVPKNIRLIFRKIDIFDPVSLEKCSLETSRNILVSPMNDKDTARVLLAVSSIINSADNANVRVGALVADNDYVFPPTVAGRHNVTTVQMHNVIARMIAHSCTQTGLSDTFRELFNFEGNEFYVVEIPEAAGLSFGEVTYRMESAVPMGVIHEGRTVLNPGKDMIVAQGDKIVVFAEKEDSAVLGQNSGYHGEPVPKAKMNDAKENVVVIGYNSTFAKVIAELPMHVSEVIAAGIDSDKYGEVKAADEARADIGISIYGEDIGEEANLLELAGRTKHFVLLADYEMEEEDADLKVIFLILRLRDLRARYGLEFNITAEMCKKSNQNLIMDGEHFDYVVASNMSSIFLAQLSENPELTDAFKEILSSRGSELYLKKAGEFGCEGDYTTLQLRNIALENEYVFIGYMKAADYTSYFNPGLDEVIHLEKDDSLIVLGEN